MLFIKWWFDSVVVVCECLEFVEMEMEWVEFSEVG